MHSLFAHDPIAFVSASRDATVYATVVLTFLFIHSEFIISTYRVLASNVEMPWKKTKRDFLFFFGSNPPMGPKGIVIMKKNRSQKEYMSKQASLPIYKKATILYRSGGSLSIVL